MLLWFLPKSFLKRKLQNQRRKDREERPYLCECKRSFLRINFRALYPLNQLNSKVWPYFFAACPQEPAVVEETLTIGRHGCGWGPARART